MKHFTLKGKLLAASLASLLVLMTGVLWVTISALGTMDGNGLSARMAAASSTANASVESIAMRMRGYADSIARDHRLAQALASADRENLESALVSAHKYLSENDQGLTTLEVSNAAGIIQMRGHNPTKHGDDKRSHPMVAAALAGQRVTDFTVSPTTGKMALDAIVPVRLNGAIVGTLKAGSYLNMQTAEDIKSLVSAEVAFAIGEQLVASTLPTAQQQLPASAWQIEDPQQPVLATIADIRYGIATIPLRNRDQEQMASLIVMLDNSAATAVVQSSITRIAMVSGAILLLTLVGMRLFAHSITGPIQLMRNHMHTIAGGAGDLTARLPSDGHDEIAQIAMAFNAMMEKQRTIMAQVKQVAIEIAAGTTQIGTTTAAVNGSLNSQQAETEQVATALNEMTASARDVASSASDAAEQSAIAKASAEEGKELVSNNLRATDDMAGVIRNAADIIGKLKGDANDIGGVLDVIRSIAEQTNLLALNAAIEAARAGEAGRGFAVVADEVRTLASRTQTSTKEIQAMIERLQNGANHAVHAINSETKELDAVIDMAHRIDNAFEQIQSAMLALTGNNMQIATATEEQHTVANSLDHAVIHLSEEGAANAAAVAQISLAGSSLAALAADLKSTTEQFKTS